MAVRKQKIGTIPCPLCGVECVVKADEGDSNKTLNYVCHMGCDSPNYAPKGTDAHKIVLSRMKLTAAPVVAKQEPAKPAAKPAPAAPPAPATQQQKAGFFS